MTETQCPNGEVRLLAHVQRRSDAFAPKTIYEIIHLSFFALLGAAGCVWLKAA
jgi:hypothetical protein